MRLVGYTANSTDSARRLRTPLLPERRGCNVLDGPALGTRIDHAEDVSVIIQCERRVAIESRSSPVATASSSMSLATNPYRYQPTDSGPG